MAPVVWATLHLLSTNEGRWKEWERLVQNRRCMRSMWRSGWGGLRVEETPGLRFTYQVLPGILLSPAILPSGKISQSNYNVVVKLFSPICVTQDRLGRIT